MQTIIVEIYIPAISSSFDFRLPSTGKIADIVNEAIWILETTQQNLLFDHDQPVLCDCEREIILDQHTTVAEAGLRDGTRLMLM